MATTLVRRRRRRSSIGPVKGRDRGRIDSGAGAPRCTSHRTIVLLLTVKETMQTGKTKGARTRQHHRLPAARACLDRRGLDPGAALREASSREGSPCQRMSAHIQPTRPAPLSEPATSLAVVISAPCPITRYLLHPLLRFIPLPPRPLLRPLLLAHRRATHKRVPLLR